MAEVIKVTRVVEVVRVVGGVSRVGHIRRFVHVAPQNPLMANPVKVCYSTFLFEGP